MKLRSRKFYATGPYRRILLCLLAVIFFLKVKSPESMPNPDLASSGYRCGIRFKKSKTPNQCQTPIKQVVATNSYFSPKSQNPKTASLPPLSKLWPLIAIPLLKVKPPNLHHTQKTATQIHAQLPSISLLNLGQSLYQASTVICQPLLRFLIIRHNALNLSPELLRMIHMQSMAKFVNHNIILHPLWGKHK